MFNRLITVAFDALRDAMSDPDGHAYLHLLTGKVVLLPPQDRPQVYDAATFARLDIAARPDDWLEVPSGDLDSFAGQRAFFEWAAGEHLLISLR